jgi:hypothetical protein
MELYQNRAQGMILVLCAVRESGNAPSSRETLALIQKNGWYNLRAADDLPPYDSQTEPGYQTLLRWARKDAVELELIANDHRDEWAMTRRGSQSLDKLLGKFRSQEFAVQRCYLWTPLFKRFVDPMYSESEHDTLRPAPKPRRGDTRKRSESLLKGLV